MRLRGDPNIPDDPTAVDVAGGTEAAISRNILPLENQDDEYDTYGKTLAQKFRAMGQSDNKVYLDVQNNINGIICLAEMNYLSAG